MSTIDYGAPIQVLAAVRGHPFDRTAFENMFADMAGISVTMVDQPAAALLMNPDDMAGFDALLLYDMPGMDFSVGAGGPAQVPPPEKLRTGLEALLRAGKGVVALHHALAGWPAWPAYADLLGGSFLYRPATLRGNACLDSGYMHEVEHKVSIVDAAHPVTAGLPPHFTLRDEVYLAEIFEEDIVPLLRSDYAFDAGHFWSAAAAVDGRMFNRDGWEHPPGSNCIGWAKPALGSPLVYLQPGDGPEAYANPHVRRLVENALRWVITPAAQEWARAAEKG